MKVKFCIIGMGKSQFILLISDILYILKLLKVGISYLLVLINCFFVE